MPDMLTKNGFRKVAMLQSVKYLIISCYYTIKINQIIIISVCNCKKQIFLKKALKECFCSVAVGVLFEIKAYLDDMTVVGGSNSVSSEAVP